MVPSGENPSLTVGEHTYALVLHMRPEMVDADLAPIKAQVPGLEFCDKPQHSTCRRS
jgi:hypothetical protein